jgi:predicted KAP-like P-loop ATPase
MSAKDEKNKTFPISGDQPICNESEDLFGREQFAKTLVSNIYVHCQDTHSCVVIALDGQWGEGKTSLLNRIHSLMSEKISPKTNTPTKDDSIIQVRYNPWLCTNQESLLVDFFQHLLKGLKGDPFLKNKILTYTKRIMNPLSTLAGAIPIPGASAAVKAGCALGEELIDNALDEKSLCALKKEIDETIGDSNKHLIVYIDDLDRLDKKECHACN